MVLTGWRSHRMIDLCREVLSFYCSDLFTKCDVIAKFLGPIYQGLSKVCIAVGAHLISVIQGKSYRTLALPIYAAKHLRLYGLTAVVVKLLILLVVHLWSQIQTK